ncbi:MAG: DUF1614 domain-containing protein [Planctomycetota bacterium]|nr:MAG: DUF1614 domain-containing protein [Planctomycetota bacterium]
MPEPSRPIRATVSAMATGYTLDRELATGRRSAVVRVEERCGLPAASNRGQRRRRERPFEVVCGGGVSHRRTPHRCCERKASVSSRMEPPLPPVPPIYPMIGCASLLLALLFVLLLPLLLMDLMQTALIRLHLTPAAALLTVLGIFVGSVINIPVYRIEREEWQPVYVVGPLGLGLFSDRFRRVRQETIIAINVGGCVIPCLLVLWELTHIVPLGSDALVRTLVVTALNIGACYAVARPVPGLGIMMPGFVSPLVAVSASWLVMIGMPEIRVAAAFIAGVLGPLVGADLLHLREVRGVAMGMLSIGGAGTFDGIVLSGILAAVLA